MEFFAVKGGKSVGGKAAEAARLKAIAQELQTIASKLSSNFFSETSVAFDGSADLVCSAPPSEALLATARAIYRSRRQRARAFQDADLFGEPAWDILLDLFIAEGEAKPLSITAACIGSGVPSSTALRWLVLLEQRELVERRADPRDARRVFLRLTARGRAAMEETLLQSELNLIGAGSPQAES